MSRDTGPESGVCCDPVRAASGTRACRCGGLRGARSGSPRPASVQQRRPRNATGGPASHGSRPEASIARGSARRRQLGEVDLLGVSTSVAVSAARSRRPGSARSAAAAGGARPRRRRSPCRTSGAAASAARRPTNSGPRTRAGTARSGRRPGPRAGRPPLNAPAEAPWTSSKRRQAELLDRRRHPGRDDAAHPAALDHQRDRRPSVRAPGLEPWSRRRRSARSTGWCAGPRSSRRRRGEGIGGELEDRESHRRQGTVTRRGSVTRPGAARSTSLMSAGSGWGWRRSAGRLHQRRPRRRPGRRAPPWRRCGRRAHAVLDAAYAAGRALLRRRPLLRPGRGVPRARGLPSGASARAAVSVGSKWGYTYTAGWRLDADVNEVKDLTRRRRCAARRQETRALSATRSALYQIHSATVDSGVLEDRCGARRAGAAARRGGLVHRAVADGPRAGRDVSGRWSRRLRRVQATWNLLEPSAGPALAAAHEAGLGVIIKEAVANGRLTDRGDAPRCRGRGRALASPRTRWRWRACWRSPGSTSC